MNHKTFMTVVSWVFLAYAVYGAGQLLDFVQPLRVPTMVSWLVVLFTGYLGYRGMQLSR